MEVLDWLLWMSVSSERAIIVASYLDPIVIASNKTCYTQVQWLFVYWYVVNFWLVCSPSRLESDFVGIFCCKICKIFEVRPGYINFISCVVLFSPCDLFNVIVCCFILVARNLFNLIYLDFFNWFARVFLITIGSLIFAVRVYLTTLLFIVFITNFHFLRKYTGTININTNGYVCSAFKIGSAFYESAEHLFDFLW